MKRIIKKYPNRRLYDTKINAYITLDDVKVLVINSIDVQVIDAKTKKDLTQMTLLQIITENESGKTPIFTVPVLQNFIRLYHEKSQSLLSKYLEDAMSLFEKQKSIFSTQWESYQQKAMQMPVWWLPESPPTLRKKSTVKKNK